MKPIRLTDKARTDLHPIADHIAERDERTAARVVNTLLEHIRGLSSRNTGRYGRISGTYEKSVPRLPFVIVYLCEQDVLTILRVIHTRRDWSQIDL